MLPEITFNDGNKIIVTDNDIEHIVNIATIRLAARAKHPPVSFADIYCIVHNATFTYLENKVKALAQKTDSEPRFYIEEMFAKGHYNSICLLVDNRVTVPMRFE